MITGIGIVTVWVLDQDSARRYYTEKLGFEVTADVELGTGCAGSTVRPPGGAQELLAHGPTRSMLDAETGPKVRGAGRAGGAQPRGDGHHRLPSRPCGAGGAGADFSQGPEERPYGTEAILRDDSGNWFSFTQRAG